MTKSRAARVCSAAAALLTLANVAPAHAGPLQRTESVVIDLSCVATTTQGGSVFVYGGVSDMGSGAGAFIEMLDQPGLDGQGGSLMVSDGISASVDLFSVSDGSPAGTLSLAARVADVLEPQVEVIDDQVGNTWTRGSFSIEEYVVEDVVIEVTGMDIAQGSASCQASRYAFDVTSNDPEGIVLNFSDFGSGICALDGLDDAFVRLSGEPTAPYVEIVVDDGEHPAKAAGSLVRQGSSWVGSLALVDLERQEAVATLDVGVTLKRAGGTTAVRWSADGWTEQQWITPYLGHVTVSSSAGRASAATCAGSQTRGQVRIAPHSDTDH